MLTRINHAGTKQQGFTIIEVVVASSILILAIGTSLIVLQQGMRAIDNARYMTLAGQILQSQMEKLRLLSWPQLVWDTDKGPFPTSASVSRSPDIYISSSSTTYENFGPTVSWFAPDVNISGASNAQLNNFKVNGVGNRCLQTIVKPSVIDGSSSAVYDDSMRIIILTATWSGSDGRTHSLTYTSRYVRHGISDFLYTLH